MRKITFILSLAISLLAGVKVWAQTYPEVSTSEAPRWYTIKSFNRGGYLTDCGSGQSLSHVEINEGSYWRFEAGTGDGALHMFSLIGNALATKWTTGNEPMDVWVLSNGVNTEGVSISGGSTTEDACIDANNYNTGVGTWHPSSSDWQGTTWVFAEVDNPLPALRQSLQEAIDEATARQGDGIGHCGDLTAEIAAAQSVLESGTTAEALIQAKETLATAVTMLRSKHLSMAGIITSAAPCLAITISRVSIRLCMPMAHTTIGLR